LKRIGLCNPVNGYKNTVIMIGDCLIFEDLKSLTVLYRQSPTIPEPNPFHETSNGSWSSKSSVLDPAYAWVLYTDDGVVGAGFNEKADISVWPVCS
jgi:hypothetical protein